MFRAIPVPSKICANKIIEKNHNLHQKKIREMRPDIDNKAPSTYQFLSSRKKKEQIQEDKFSEIERANKLLLEKITTIMQKPNNTVPLATNQTLTSTSFFDPNQKKSLNKDYRKRELVKITMENQAILKRIQEKKPYYKVKTWERDREMSERYLLNISEFPRSVSGTKKQMATTQGKMRPDMRIYDDMSKTLYTNEENEENDKSLRRNRKIVIYKKSRKIGLGYYIIEIYFENEFFRIHVEDVENPLNYFLELKEQEGMHLLRIECKNNVENILERMKFEREELIIKGTEHRFQNLGAEKPPTNFKTNAHDGDKIIRSNIKAVTTKEDGSPKMNFQKQSSLRDDQNSTPEKASNSRQNNRNEKKSQIVEQEEEDKQNENEINSKNSMIEKDVEDDGDFYHEDFQTNGSNMKSKEDLQKNMTSSNVKEELNEPIENE